MIIVTTTEPNLKWHIRFCGSSEAPIDDIPTSRSIWLIFTRTVTPLEIFRWFPQIVFTLRTCVRPINVGFSNRFFCLSDKRCLMLIIKKNVEEDKS